MDERLAYLSFSLVSGIGPKTFELLLKKFGTAQKAWGSSVNELKDAGLGPKTLEEFIKFRNEFNFSDYLNKLKKTKCGFIAFCEESYPEGLKKLPNPPIVIFTKGNKECLNLGKSIGVVGTRKITRYGLDVTQDIVSELVCNNIVITSGMALGVDAVAHSTCIANKGKTIAVLGCGVDCPFPKENERLYEEILDGKGLIISEYPLGMEPSIGSFPARNRIIAALSLGVLVTEAGEDSGSLITADWGLKLGKKVFAVPGPITSRMSDGTTKLLKQGAVLVSGVQDILQQLQINNEQLTKGVKKRDFKKMGMAKDEIKILKLLENESLDCDEIANRMKKNISKVSILLSGLEINGVIKQELGGYCLAR